MGKQTVVHADNGISLSDKKRVCTLKTTERHGRTLNAYCYVTEVSVKGLPSV